MQSSKIKDIGCLEEKAKWHAVDLMISYATTTTFVLGTSRGFVRVR